jgi:hypothetical protein
MEKHSCSKCKKDKPFTDFNKSTASANGLQAKCRDCEKFYRQSNKEKIKDRNKKYNRSNKKEIKIKKQAYYLKNKKEISQKQKNYNQINKKSIKIKKQTYFQKNKRKIIETNKNWRLNHLEEYRKYQREYVKNKRNTNPHYKLEHRLRNRLLIGLKKNGDKKLNKFWDLVKCTKQELKNHIESQFTEGMSWELFNNGQIVIDHIKPCCSFDLSKLEHQQECFCYMNLRPLWKKDNGTKISQDLKQRIK